MWGKERFYRPKLIIRLLIFLLFFTLYAHKIIASPKESILANLDLIDNLSFEFKQQATFDYNKEISLQENNTENLSNLNLINHDVDELYNKALDIIVSQQKVSTSFIQRYLQIGYNRAARIIEKMEENGIISEANNAGKRQVLKKK